MRRNGNIGVDVKAFALDDPAYGFAPWHKEASSPRPWFDVGLVAAWRRRRHLRRARDAADAELLESEFTTPRTAWRAAELTAVKNRLAVARSIEQLLRSADTRYLPGSTPLNRVAVRESAERFRSAAARLRDLDRPVAARGVVQLDRLLVDGYGPLYVSYRAVELRDALARACAALEGGR